MKNNKERKALVLISKYVFDQVKRLYTKKTKQEVLEITNLSLLVCNFEFVISL